MNRTLFKTMTWLMWLALPLTALRYWLVWDRLPMRMATHFDAANRPNGWMSREVSLEFALGMTAFLLVILTVVAYVAQKRQVADTFSWALLGFFYVVIGTIYYIDGRILDYNLTGRPMDVAPVLILTPIAILALTAIYLGTKRGESLPAAPPIAQEVHASRLWTLVFLLPLALELGIFATVPLAGMRVAAVLLSLMFLAFAALTWSGFQYRFTPAGVEICTLGFRLRSIPLNQIQSYEVGKWNLLRGYGIRGVGDQRAYVWCNQGVRIKTSGGEVFLGHREPERIIRDLDAIKQFAH
jgi:hypothetical protein